VICENAGFGSNSSAPIASLMIEKYLKDSISGSERKAKVETISKLNLMPPRIVAELRQRDSIARAKSTKDISEKSYIKSINDTMNMEDDENPDTLEELNKSKQNDQPKRDTLPSGKENIKKNNLNAVLPDKQKKQIKNDSLL
ncbi:MAG: hypothetical protein ABI280_15805, partial [Ginsengibacter sp.]